MNRRAIHWSRATRDSSARPRLWLAALATALAALCLAVPAAEAAFPGTNGKIAYMRVTPLAAGDIWTMDANGLNQTQVTTNPALDANPAYSPDGTKIAFMSMRDGNAEIYVMDANGTGQTRITNNAVTDDNPAFSPDGSRIAFETNRDGNTEIYVMNANGSAPVNRTNSPAADEDPAFAPLSDRLAFRTTRDNADGEIYAIDASGSNPTRLTNNTTVERDPNFSPDATRVAFTQNDPLVGGTIVAVDASSGGNVKTLTPTFYPSDSREPAFSPDPTICVRVPPPGDPCRGEIAYSHLGSLFDPPSDREIRTMNADDGANRLNRTNTPGFTESTPDWGPQAGTTPTPRAVSIADTTVSEGDTGEVDATFTVSLSAAAAYPVEVDFQTADDSATAPGDYAAQSGTVSFATGETTKTVTVKVKGDTLQEPTERFFVNLSNPRGVTVADAQGAGTITDNDAPSSVPRLTIDAKTVTEGNTGEVDMTFTVSLSEPSATQVTVDFQTADHSARAPADYTARSGTLTFAPNDTSETVTVKVQGDVIDELDERFRLNLANPVGATIGDGQGDGTITDDDQAALSINDTAVTEADFGPPVEATFTVSLSVPSSRQVDVSFATADDTAIAPGDYAAKTGIVSFAPGETSKPVTVLVRGDEADEDNERFFVNLSAPSQATVADGQGIATITDDDAPGPPSVSIADTTVSEGNSGETDATFAVSLSEASTQPVTIAYATADDSAVSPADYTAGSGPVTFAAGETAKQVTVKVKADGVDEDNERFSVNLSAPQGATVQDGQGVGTITDDDPQPTISVGNATVTEGNIGEKDATFSVSLSGPSAGLVKVSAATANGSATVPADYAAATPRLTFLAGQTSKTVTVKVKGDTLDEPNENFLLNLSNPENATIADGQGVGTITDDDAPAGGGGTPPPGGGGPGAVVPDTVRPLLGALSLSRTRFRAARSGPSTATAIATRVSYTLSEAASVRFRVERALPGRRVGGRCVRATRSNRSKRRCTRYITLRGSFSDRGERGSNRFTFRGRLRGRALRPGRYRLRAVARDAAGNRSSLRRSRGFRIVRR